MYCISARFLHRLTFDRESAIWACGDNDICVSQKAVALDNPGLRKVLLCTKVDRLIVASAHDGQQAIQQAGYVQLARAVHFMHSQPLGCLHSVLKTNTTCATVKH